MNSQIYEKVWRNIFSRIFFLWILMMIWFLLLFTFKKIMEKTSHNVHSALCYGKVRKPSGFVFSLRIPWFAKWPDLILHIFSNRTNSKQENIRIPCLPLDCYVAIFERLWLKYLSFVSKNLRIIMISFLMSKILLDLIKLNKLY